ncbi:hypothetical protein [Hyalangium rubrum]|uniref:DUF4340 domain-containing protein n=1 Tax=Hyalangium rubrum TaxID=3103134 RepID=A0ABU5H6M3_9BACT|nr:hypothetical protein [Hyalangium sp. s54d21]MDY7229113.1 hypothetical protein [Hyalangium sp. s54d21]
MNVRGVTLQAGLAVVGLVAAFFVWQREPEGMPGEVTVLDVSKRALQRIRYDDATRSVELYRDASDEDTVWVRLGEKPPPPPAPKPTATDGGVGDGGVPGTGADGGVGAPTGGADAGTPAAPPPPPPPRELRGNETARNFFARLAPLKATRALGELDAKKQEELGLTNSPRKLTLTVDGREHAFVLATPSGNSWGSPYLRRDDGRVFLLGPTVLPDLEGASSRLVDRRMHAFEQGEYDAFTVTQGKNSRAFVVSGKPPAPVTVAPQGAPDKPDEFARNWHDRVWRLLPMDFVGRGDEPPGGAPEEVFRVEYKLGAKVVGHVIVARGDKGDFFARTEHTPGWAKLHTGVDTLATEAAKVASGAASGG